MQPTVLLFDIDGTLITTGGVGRRALETTFETLHSRGDACKGFSLSGMTDRGIVRLGLEAIAHPVSEAEIDRVLAHYLVCLKHQISSSVREKYRVHPGMQAAVLAGLSAGCAVGLGTGNVREGARIKLEHVGLYSHFSFGGFGDDHEDRATLIRRGAERGVEKLGVKFEQARVVIIGDTPKDVRAAHAIGAECIGVATGEHPCEELVRAGADAVFENFTAEGAIDSLLGGARSE